MLVTIRPLTLTDAETSWKWRNDPEIWRYTGAKPDKPITPEIERDWLAQALQRSDEFRFAICVGPINKYVGNCQLTGINNNNAELHIFIGDVAYQNLGIGTKATKLLLKYAQHELGLKEVFLSVDSENRSAISVYKKSGFVFSDDNLGRITMKRMLNTANA